MKETKTNVMRILEKEKIPYEAHSYPHRKDAVDGVTVAELTGQNPDYVFKTLMTVSNKKEYFASAMSDNWKNRLGDSTLSPRRFSNILQ